MELVPTDVMTSDTRRVVSVTSLQWHREDLCAESGSLWGWREGLGTFQGWAEPTAHPGLLGPCVFFLVLTLLQKDDLKR